MDSVRQQLSSPHRHSARFCASGPFGMPSSVGTVEQKQILCDKNLNLGLCGLVTYLFAGLNALAICESKY